MNPQLITPTGRRGKAPKGARRKLWRRDPRCAYCGKPLTLGSSTIDHIIPRSRGGLNAHPNLALCCAPCNRAKEVRTLGEWAYDLIRACLNLGDPSEQTEWRRNMETILSTEPRDKVLPESGQYSVEDLARILHYEPATLREKIKSQGIPAFTVGSKTIVDAKWFRTDAAGPKAGEA